MLPQSRKVSACRLVGVSACPDKNQQDVSRAEWVSSYDLKPQHLHRGTPKQSDSRRPAEPCIAVIISITYAGGGWGGDGTYPLAPRAVEKVEVLCSATIQKTSRVRIDGVWRVAVSLVVLPKAIPRVAAETPLGNCRYAASHKKKRTHSHTRTHTHRQPGSQRVETRRRSSPPVVTVQARCGVAMRCRTTDHTLVRSRAQADENLSAVDVHAEQPCVWRDELLQ